MAHLQSEDEVRSAWACSDATTYLWHFSPSAGDFRQFLGQLAVLLFVVPVLSLALWVVSRLRPGWFADVFLVLAGALVVAWILALLISSRAKSRVRHTARRAQFWFLAGAIALLLCVLTEPGRLKDLVPGVEPTGIGSVIVYYYDNVFDVMLLSLPHDLGYRLSSLQGQGTAPYLLEGLRALVGIFVLFALGTLLRTTAAGAEFFGTVKECCECLLKLPGNGNALVRRAGIIQRQTSAEFPLPDVVKAYQHLTESDPSKRKEADPKTGHIRAAWDWDDATVYQWELALPPRSRVAVTLLLAVYLLLAPVVMIPLIYSLYYFLQYVGGLLMLAFFKVLIFVQGMVGRDVTEMKAFWTLGTATELIIKIWMYVLVPVILLGSLAKRFGKSKEKSFMPAGMTFEVSAAITLLLLLIGLALPGSTLAQGFKVPEGGGLWNWYLYALENFGDALFFGIPTRLGFHPSGISPDSRWANLVVIFMRLLIGAGLVAMLWKWVGLGYSRRVFVHGLLPAVWAECSLYETHPEAKAVRVRRLGPLQEMEEESAEEVVFVRAQKNPVAPVP